MYKCRAATTKENIWFQKRFCQNEQMAFQLIKNFKIEIEVYEELPPWHGVYNANGSDILLKDTIIMLKVCDLAKRIVYYPVFSEKVGKRLLARWDMPLTPKITVFADSGAEKEASAGIHEDNRSLRRLIEFARLFTIVPDRLHRPMPYGFNNLYSQLHRGPEMGVAPETVRMINGILADFINRCDQERYICCDNLQDFIDYLKNKYKLLEFKEGDFTSLREIMKANYPDDKIYF